jgi:hypothetical protein
MGTGRRRALWFVAVALSGGCGQTRSGTLFDPGKRPDSSVCVTGEERCECYGNDTCNSGLTCASRICVVLPRASGGTGGTRTTAAGGGPSSPPPFRDSGLDGDAGVAHGSGGARPGTAGAPANGGRPASGGGHPETGGAAGAGGITTSSGGTASTGGLSDDGGACLSGWKFCGGICTLPAPRVGCGLTGCQPCTLQPPANGYVTCGGDQCVFECLSGYQKNGVQCEGSGAGGSTNNCPLASCPNCNVQQGSKCCTSDGKCGCPLIPYVTPTCAAN